MNPEREALERLWTGFPECLTENGIVSHPGVLLIPKCPIVVSKYGQNFTLSMTTVQVSLGLFRHSLLTHNFYSRVFVGL